MGLETVFLDFFSNIFNLVISLMMIAIGMLFGVVFVRFILKPKNQMVYLRERDGRGMELDILDEDALSMETNSNPKLRFYKYGRAYEFRKWGRAFTRFFGKEGTAYTWRLEGFTKIPSKYEMKEVEKGVKQRDGTVILQKVKEKTPVEWEDKKIELDFPTLEDAIKFKWGEQFYNTVPEQMKEKLRDDKVYCTVNLEPGIVPEGYEPITEHTIKKKANEDMAALIAESSKGVIKKDIFERIAWIGCGIAIGLGIYIFILA